MSNLTNQGGSGNPNLPSVQDFIAAAVKLWNEPTSKTSTEWRFGKHGSKSIDLVKLTWHDHQGETPGKPSSSGGTGGGAIELCRLAGVKWGNVHKFEPDEVYQYPDERGTVLFEVCRFPNHKFLQRKPGRPFKEGIKGVRRVLFRLPQLLAANPAVTVLITEGEKDVLTCERLGFTATCNPGGAGKWRSEYSIFFKDKDVVILNDADSAGRKHRDEIIGYLGSLPSGIRVLELPGAKDISDWVAKGGTADELLRLLDTAQAPEMVAPEVDLSSEAEREWLSRCIMSEGRKPFPLPILANVLIALRVDFADTFAFDEIAGCSMIRQSPDRPVVDDDITDFQEWLQKVGLKQVSAATVHQAIESHARDHAFHPLRDKIKALPWDRKNRLDTWLIYYLGVEDSPYARAVGRMFLISMMARIFKPGCKVDHMLVLEGPQGELKSMLCRTLAGEEHFSDSLPDISEKDAQQHLKGIWVVEIAEMHAFSRAEATLLKSYVSRQVEIYRPPFGRLPVREARQCVFVGTSNKDQYLRDETGGRRFWPVKCTSIDIPAFRTDRDQLLAEAYEAYKAGEHWWPDKEFEREVIAREQAARYEFDEWSPIVSDWIDQLNPPADNLTVARVASGALGIPSERLHPPVQKRISAILRNLNWRWKHTEKGNLFLPPLKAEPS